MITKTDRTEKKCHKCKTVKPLKEFNRDWSKSADGHKYSCRECDKIRRQANRFGITEEMWLFLSSKKECEICGSTNDLVLDHDHNLGMARGRLCRSCNVAISILDKPDLLLKANIYLSKPCSQIKVNKTF